MTLKTKLNFLYLWLGVLFVWIGAIAGQKCAPDACLYLWAAAISAGAMWFTAINITNILE